MQYTLNIFVTLFHPETRSFTIMKYKVENLKKIIKELTKTIDKFSINDSVNKEHFIV